MKTGHFLARIAAFVTAAATIGMVLGPARADAADHQPDGSANRDLRSSMAEELGSRLDGWTNPDLDISSSDLWAPMAEELGSRLDGWTHERPAGRGESIRRAVSRRIQLTARCAASRHQLRRRRHVAPTRER
jgi:hypothetical protein